MPNIMLMLLIIILIIIIIYNTNNYKEGINLGKVKKAIKDVGKFGSDIGKLGKKLGKEMSKVKDLGKEIEKTAKVPIKMIKDLPKEIENIAKEAENKIKGAFDEAKDFLKGIIDEVWDEIKSIIKKIEKIPKQVEDLAESIFLDYIPNFLKECWNQFNKHVIKPIKDFFNNIGYLFTHTGDVFKEIIKKLISIPTCIPIYMIEASRSGYNYVYKKYFPGWLRSIMEFIDTYIIQLIIVPVFGFFLYITKLILQLLGFNFPSYDYESKKQKCMDFGPIFTFFSKLIGVLTEVFNILETIFDALNIDEIIDAIMSIFTGKKKKKKSSSSSRVQNTVKNTVDGLINTTTGTIDNISSTSQNSINNTLDSAKNMLSSVGIDVPTTDISGSLSNVQSSISSLKGFF